MKYELLSRQQNQELLDHDLKIRFHPKPNEQWDRKQELSKAK